MSNNERQRKYMEKVLASPTKHASYLAKEKDWRNKRKEVKALQTQTMSERDKRNHKRKWTLWVGVGGHVTLVDTDSRQRAL